MILNLPYQAHLISSKAFRGAIFAAIRRNDITGTQGLWLVLEHLMLRDDLERRRRLTDRIAA